MTHPDFRSLCAELHEECFALYAEMSASQDFNDAYLQRMDALRDRSSAALAAPQQGAPSDDELARFFHSTYEHLAPEFGYETRADTKQFDPQSSNGKLMVAVAAAVLTRYGAQAAPVAPSNICTGCGTPRHEAITAIANGAMACCPDCSTLTVEDRNAIRAIKAVPVPAPDVHYDFAVYDALTDEPQAGGEAPTLEEAQREGQHYFAMYSEDGPMRLELRRVEVLPLPEAQP